MSWKATETPELHYDKERLLANGDRWERAIAKNIALDAPIDDPWPAPGLGHWHEEEVRAGHRRTYVCFQAD